MKIDKVVSVTHKMPSPAEVVQSIEENFKENIKPSLDEWAKIQVRFGGK